MLRDIFPLFLQNFMLSPEQYGTSLSRLATITRLLARLFHALPQIMSVSTHRVICAMDLGQRKYDYSHWCDGGVAVNCLDDGFALKHSPLAVLRFGGSASDNGTTTT